MPKTLRVDATDYAGGGPAPRVSGTRVSGTPASVSVTPAPATELLAIDFAAPWRDSPFLAQHPQGILGCRCLGVAEARLPAGHPSLTHGSGAVQTALLLRHIHSKSYRLLGAFGVLGLPALDVDTFLQRIRQGHHGGPGRCQGTLTRDGLSYTRKFSLMLSTRVIRWGIRQGHDVLSLGLRRLATQAAAQMLDDAGAPIPSLLAPDTVTPGFASGNKRCHAYLDGESARVFRLLGGGNLSFGIRRAHGHIAGLAR